jgi:hypothetical protein
MNSRDRQVQGLPSSAQLSPNFPSRRFLCRLLRPDASRGHRAIQCLAAAAVAIVLHLAANVQAGIIVTLQSGVSPSGAYQTQDAHVRNDGANVATTDNNTRILFGAVATGALRGLYSFPLSSIPANATINSVEFHVMQVDTDANSQAGNLSVELRSVSQSFVEGAAVTGVGGSNWNNTFGGSMTLGGSILSSATMNPRPATLPIPATPSTWIDTTFATGASLVAAVQSQLNASQPFNFTLVVPSSIETGGVRRFLRTPSNSEAATTTANRPRLIIDYTPAVPEPSAAALAVLGLPLLGIRRWRSARRNLGTSEVA